MESRSTEAPVSITFDITDHHGIKTLITLRGTSTELGDVAALLADRDALVDSLIAEGWRPTMAFPKFNNDPAPVVKQNTVVEDDTPSCACGPMRFKSGNKNGKAWSGYMCPTRAHDPVWIK